MFACPCLENIYDLHYKKFKKKKEISTTITTKIANYSFIINIIIIIVEYLYI